MTPELPENYFRHEHGRLVSILSRRFGAQSIELCEDAAQAALLRAVETWDRAEEAPRVRHLRVVEEPGAWLYRVAHHYLIDAVRAQGRHPAGAAEEGERSEDPAADAVVLSTELQDDLLRMLFLCADPEIPYDSQLALALKTLCGFSTEEIALRLFQSTDAIHKRLQRARARLRERGTELDMPSLPELEQRVPSILQMLYLLFSEGYSSAKPDSVIRRELCDEAIRLARVLVEHPIGALPQTDALLALMYLHASRFDARFDSVGGLLMMKELGLISRLPRIVVAQAERANPLYRSYLRNFESFEPVQAKKTLASAIQIGNPVSFQKAVRALKQFNGIVEQATEEELADAAALGDRTGMFNCPHTGVALAVLLKLLKSGKIDGSERVVLISTAHGLKFVEMKVKYHQRELDFPCHHANQPIELPARLDAVKEALHKALEKKSELKG